MSRPSERRPADFVRANVPDARLSEMWSGIERAESELGARRRRRRVAGAGALLLAVTLVALHLARAPSASQGSADGAAPAATNLAGPRQLSLADGTTLSLGAGTRARVVAMAEKEVRVRLEHGTLLCEVPVDHRRRFVVDVAGFEVVVRGTRFTVSFATDPAVPKGVGVSVERGLVEVREPPERTLALLGPGQHWSSDLRAVPPLPPASVTEPCSACAPPPSASGSALPLPATVPSASATDAGPKAVFERANAARLAGSASEAAAAFDELRRRYPTDPRAGYAAFMLGRIRLDTLGDANGAVDAFSFAVAHPGGGFFLEDAEARLVEAFAEAGRATECRRARDRFLVSHPKAARAALVAKQCGAP